MSKFTEDSFKFWCPIEKAQEPVFDNEGEEVMRLGGIASTMDEDSDGEFLDPKGFDIKPLISSGMVNWHHQSKGQPNAIIGEPSKAEIRAEGLYIETDLYRSSQIAKDVWELAKVLEKDSKTRRLGYSIEGKVVRRKSNIKNSPDYKVIEKALITGVAITHQPKNPKTFANIIKGEIDNKDFHEEDEEDVEEKGLGTGEGAAVTKESVDKKLKPQTLTKSEVVDRIFKDIPVITIEKAKEIHIMLIKFANMKGRKNVTDDDITKAYEALGLEVQVEDVQKGHDSEEDEDPKEDTISKTSKKEKTDDEEDDGSNDEEDSTEDVKKSNGVNRFDRIEKAIATSHQINSKYIKALGVMVKDASQKLVDAAGREEEMLELVKAQEETISSLSERLEVFGSSVSAPKSISSGRTIDRVFNKGNDNDFENGNGRQESNAKRLSMTSQRALVAEVLDQATFSKGYDDEFSKAVTHFEAVKSLPANIISRIKSEYGIEIVK